MRRRLRPLLSALFVTVLATVVAAPAAVLGAPEIVAMTFDPDTIPLNGTSTLNFAIFNPDESSTLTGLAFTDTLPAGLSVVNGSTTVCFDNLGTLTTSGGNTIAFTRASFGPTWGCQFSVTVTGTSAGIHVNTTGSFHSTNGGDGAPATATLTVLAPPAPPTIAKHFGAATVVHGDSTSLTFTITNPNSATALTGIGFSDTFPGGLVVGYPNGLTGSCGGGTITAVASTSVVTLAGASLAGLASCTFSIDVIGAAFGLQTNTTGQISSAEGGTGGTATASVRVGTPPLLTMTFDPDTIPLNGTSTLHFAIFNPEGNPTLTELAFTDTLPAGLSVVNDSTTVCSDDLGILTTSGGNRIDFTKANLGAEWICQFSVTVTGTSAGIHVNTTGQITSTNDIPGSPATATLTVVAPPTLAKAFGAATVVHGDSTSLTFTITNPNSATPLTGIGFSDTFPGGLVVGYPNGLTGSCGGGTITAVASTSVVTLAGASLAGLASCTFSIDVIGAAQGTWTNTTGNVTSIEGGTGGTATASITVGVPPTLAMAFNPPSVPLNGTSELTISVGNPEWSNTDPLLGISLTDTLPAGLTVETLSTPVCFEGAGTLTSGGNTIAFGLPSLPAGWGCSFTVTVQAPGVAGAYINTAGPITSTNGIPGNVASATLFVLAPPTIAMAFDPATITLGAQAPLTFTVTNPPGNGADITGVAFTASLPAGLTVANDSLGVCGGTLATTGGNTISMSGAMVAVGSTCTFSVNVTGAALGVYTATGGPVTSANAGTGNAASASVSVVAVATPTPPAATTPPPATTPPAATTPPPATTPPAAGTTPPATSTSRSEAPGSSDPRVPLLLLLASIAGFVAVRHAENRGKYQGPR